MEHPFLTHSPEPLITVLLLPFLWMTLQTSQWSQILQIKFFRKQSAYVVLSNDKYAGNFHNANCLHIIHKGHFPNWIASAHSSFFLPIASPSIILVDSLIFGYLFTNLSSTRSLCQRAVIYLTMLLYRKKRHKFYWRFHQYLCTFFMYSFTILPLVPFHLVPLSK